MIVECKLNGSAQSPMLEVRMRINGIPPEVLRSRVRSLMVRYNIEVRDGPIVRQCQASMLHRVRPTEMKYKHNSVSFEIALRQIHRPRFSTIKVKSMVFRMRASKNNISRQIEVPIKTTLQCRDFRAFRERDVELEWEGISEKNNKTNNKETLPENKDNIPQSTNQNCSIDISELDALAEFYDREVNTNKLHIDTHDMVIKSLFSLLKFFLELKVDPDINLQPIVQQYFKKYILSEREKGEMKSLFIESDSLVGELLGN